jgi:hypothetical protein
MEADTASHPVDVAAGSAGPGGSLTPVAHRPRGSWWLLVALAACLSLVVGGTVQHAIDQRADARTLYRMQLLDTLARFGAEAQTQISRPVAKRDLSAFQNVADAISADQGINGSGTLQVNMGAGSSAQPTQIAFDATVDSPYASTTLVVWLIQINHQGVSQDQGACVLWSTLMGPTRATTPLSLGGGEYLQPCSRSWWSAKPGFMQPRLGVAGIPESPGPGGVS